VALVESAIDAISLAQMRNDIDVVSVAGCVVPDDSLGSALKAYTHVFAAFDADMAGDAAYKRLLEHHPACRRLIPAEEHKDWNDALRQAHVPAPDPLPPAPGNPRL